jgi:hypothetical protein
MSGVKNPVKLDNMNLIPTVANFIRRQRLGIYQASFLRQVSWTLMRKNTSQDPKLIFLSPQCREPSS